MLMLLFFLYLLIIGIGYGLKWLNLKHLEAHGAEVPPEFEGRIDEELLRKTRDYTVENSRFGFIESSISHLVTLLFLFGGFLSLYNRLILRLSDSFILSGIFFFLLLTYASTLLSLPFDLYSTFRIEKKYGFNTQTLKLWVADQLKSLFLSTILLGIIVGVGLRLVSASPEQWWLWVWGSFFLFGIVMMYLSPYVIEPLFNKYTPLDDPGLEEKIRVLMERVGIRVSRIFKMDASKRSRHTNAYFTGIGRVKRIVLFDTLLEKLTEPEIIAVLAHEAGHWKKKHLLKGIVLSQTLTFAGAYFAWRFTRTDLLTNLFGIEPTSFFAKLVILGFFYSIVSFPLTPLMSMLTRHYEREADDFACETSGDRESLASSLIKLARDNLSNLHPHPWYAAFYYSHPPVVERVRKIRKTSSKTKRN
ncbi:MAG: M48 family metallopeptidase [Deltaproteobacteria bacterium]|nr:M48 family metallopeptidase [Deltaproteobacteria bacterium]